MFLGQGAEVVYPIGGTTDCPDDYDYSFADSMCHLTQQSGYGNCTPPLVWSNISQDCVISVGATGGGSIISTNTVLLMGAAAFVLLLLSGGRSSGGGRKKSQKIFSRTTTRTQFA